MRRAFVLISFLFFICTILSAQEQQPTLVITHITVIDPALNSVKKDMAVIIAGDVIVKIVPNAKFLPKNAEVFDGTGKFLIPSLWDMHVHIARPEREFPMFVANGVLGVRDMANVAKDIFAWRKQTASGEVLGPEIVACGPLIDGPNSSSHAEYTLSVANPTEARKAVDDLKSQGAEFIKVYDVLSRESYLAIVDEAKKLHLPLVGHVPLAIRVIDASNIGQRSLEHEAGLQGGSTYEDELIRLQTSGPDVMQEAMRTKNFSLIPENIAKKGNAMLDHLDNARLTAFYKSLAKNDTYLDPTLVVKRVRTFIDDIAAKPDPRLRFTRRSDLDWWNPANNMFAKYRTPYYIAYRKREWKSVLEGLVLANKLGVRILAGTDTNNPFEYPGFSLHDELGLLVEAGLSPMDALRTATVNPTRFFGRNSKQLIASGTKANLVILDADPLKDIANTKKISAVVVKGKLLRRPQLDKLLQKAEQDAAK